MENLSKENKIKNIDWIALANFLLIDAQADFHNWEILKSFSDKKDKWKILAFFYIRFNKTEKQLRFEESSSKKNYLFWSLYRAENYGIEPTLEEIEKVAEELDFLRIASLGQFGLKSIKQRQICRKLIEKEKAETIFRLIVKNF